MIVYIGIDWSEKKHDIVIHNEDGKRLMQMVIEHNLTGFLQMDAARQKLGVSAGECVVGMETVHNLLIDFLWQRGYEQIYVLPPNQVKSSQGRVRQSGAHNDPGDADLIAELSRTDRHRLSPWHPGSLLLQQMRARLGLVSFLTKTVVQTSNRLRACLLRYYPAALQVFSSLDCNITLTFIEEYPSPPAASKNWTAPRPPPFLP